MRTLISPTTPEAREAPNYIRHIAKRENKEILKITENTTKGQLIQWSIRPYQQGQRTDNTVTANIQYIALRLCQELGIDYKKILEQAYPSINPAWIDHIPEFIPKETILPPLSEESLKNLLIDLITIDNQEIAEILEKEFTQLGYNLNEWWSQN